MTHILSPEFMPPEMLHILYARQYPDLELILQDIAALPDLTETDHHKKILDIVKGYEASVTNRGRQPSVPRL